MVKKALSVVLLITSVTVFATTQSSQPVKKKKHKKTVYELNKPTVGSRQQSSDQLFGAPEITGNKGQRYTGDDGGGKSNNPLVGSRQQSSDQQFGAPELTGTKGQKPDNSGSGKLNSPTVGGRQQSSDQIFGNPGDPTNQ